MSGFLDDGTAFRLGGTDGKPVIGFRMATATTGETAAGVSGNCNGQRGMTVISACGVASGIPTIRKLPHRSEFFATRQCLSTS